MVKLEAYYSLGVHDLYLGWSEFSQPQSTEKKPAETRKQTERRLNDLKYELMNLNQSLGIMTPESELAKELQTKRMTLQSQIDKLEAELRGPAIPSGDSTEQKKYKKIVQEDGKVRIWSSSSTS